MAQTLGHALLLREEGFILHGGHRMNIINSYAAGVCGDFGFEDITLSFEGTAAQLAEIRSPIPRGVVAYGRLPLMIMRRCPVSGGKPCGKVRLFDDGGTPCGECIADRRGNKMPVLCGGNSVTGSPPGRLPAVCTSGAPSNSAPAEGLYPRRAGGFVCPPVLREPR